MKAQTYSSFKYLFKLCKNSFRKIIPICVLLQLFPHPNKSSAENIKWLATISRSSAESENTSIREKVYNFIFGEDIVTLNRPVTMCLFKENLIGVLDQGLQATLFVNVKNVEIKKINKNEHKNFPSLVAICSGPGNRLYFTDSALERIFSIEPEREQIRTFAEEITFYKPTGIAYNPIKNFFYVSETGMHRILVLDESGRIIKTIGERGNGSGQFNFPTHLWIDDDGRLYIVDSMNFRIQIFSAEGEFLSMFGEAGSSSGYLARSKGIATDSDGHIYVVDGLFHAVQIFDWNGQFLFHFGKQGRGDSEFWMPSGIFIDSEDKIFVADSYNSRIQIFQYSSGKVNGE
jgi:hypothetical protein